MIYCLEDENAIQDLMVYTLKASGFDAVGFDSGKGLWLALKEQLPELILLDIMLPGEDGLSILKKLRSSPVTADIPVIIATARDSEYDTHVDRAHVHNHFVINSVNHETGMKLRQSPKTLQSLRQLSDEICSAHGLSVLKPYEQRPGVRDVKNGEYRAAVRSESWKFRLRSAITACMEMCWTPEQFCSRMREYGYETVWRADRKHITYVCMNEPPNKDGKLKKCRDRSLSDERFLKEAMENEFAIRKRILAEIEHGRADADERAVDPAPTLQDEVLKRLEVMNAELTDIL